MTGIFKKVMINMNDYSFKYLTDKAEEGVPAMKNIHQLTVPTPFHIGDVHIYLMTDDAVSLVDAGVKTKEAWKILEKQLKILGFLPEDIEQIFLTHHHPDHTGLIEKFPKAKIIAHPYVDFWLQQDSSFINHYEQYYKDLLTKMGVPKELHYKIDNLHSLLYFSGKGKLNLTLKEGDSLPGHGDWQVIETKGHAQSHLSFYRKADGAFISGDHLLLNTSPNPIIEAPYFDQIKRAQPLLEYRNSLKKCLDLKINYVLPGHGKIFTKVEDYIKFQLISQEKRAKIIFNLLRSERLTPYEISKRIFPKHYKNQLELTMSETIGQLDYLLKDKKIIREKIDGTIYYRAK